MDTNQIRDPTESEQWKIDMRQRERTIKVFILDMDEDLVHKETSNEQKSSKVNLKHLHKLIFE